MPEVIHGLRPRHNHAVRGDRSDPAEGERRRASCQTIRRTLLAPKNLKARSEPARGPRVRCPRERRAQIPLEPRMTGRIALPIPIVAALLVLAAGMPQATAQAVGPDEAHGAAERLAPHIALSPAQTAHEPAFEVASIKQSVFPGGPAYFAGFSDAAGCTQAVMTISGTGVTLTWAGLCKVAPPATRSRRVIASGATTHGPVV